MSLPITLPRSSTWSRGALWGTPHTRTWGRHSGFSRDWMGGPLCSQVLQKLKRRIDADSHVYETRKGEGHIMHTNTCFWRMFCYVTVWMQVLTSPACVINVLTFSHSITPAQTLTGEAREKGAKVSIPPLLPISPDSMRGMGVRILSAEFFLF